MAQIIHPGMHTQKQGFSKAPGLFKPSIIATVNTILEILNMT